MKLVLPFLLSWLCFLSAEAQFTEYQRLVTEGGFGGMAMSDTALVVVEYLDGSAFLRVYEKDDTSEEWVLQQTIPEPTDIDVSYSSFGFEVLIAGDTIAVRVHDAEGPYDSSAVLLFGWNGLEWVYTQTVSAAERWAPMVLTESILAFRSTFDIHILTLSGPGQVATGSEQIIMVDERVALTGQGGFLFAAASGSNSLTMYKRNPEGIYMLEQRLDGVEEGFYFMNSHMTSFETTLAVHGLEFGSGLRDIRVYSFETGSLVLQDSIEVDDVVYSDYEWDLRDIILVNNDLLLMSSRQVRYGARYALHGLDGGPLSGYSDSYRPSDDNITGFIYEDEVATSGDTFALSWDNYDERYSVVQLFQAPAPSRIRKFVLFDTDKNKRVSPSLENGAVYDRKEIGRALNIKAVTDGPVESVVFELNIFGIGSTEIEYSTDDGFPYMLRDGDPKDHRRVPKLATGGTFLLTATPYSGPGGTGRSGKPLRIGFTLT